MVKIPPVIKGILYFLFAGFLLMIIASGYLYRENKLYQNNNHRLIIQNDSILSENIELKNALRLKQSAAIKVVKKNSKTVEYK